MKSISTELSTTKIYFGLFVLANLIFSLTAQAKPVTYQVNGEDYEGYFIYPQDKPVNETPLVILVHDWDGLTGYEIKRAEMLVEQGYAVFAADLFGKGIRPTAIEDRRKCTGELYADRPKMRLLMQGAVDAALAENANIQNAVVYGYCFGGTAVLEFARSGADLKGFASFHGGLALPDGQDYSQTQGKIMIFHGTADQSITMDQFAALAMDLEKANIPNEMITYGGAPHAWTVFGSSRYRKQADENSWARFIGFLDENLKPE